MEFIKNATSDGYEYFIKGKFTFSDNQKFKDILEQTRNSPASARFITIDLGETEFMDSSAIGMLLLAKDEAKKHEKQVVIKNLQGQPKKIFDLSKLHEVFNVV